MIITGKTGSGKTSRAIKEAQSRSSVPVLFYSEEHTFNELLPKIPRQDGEAPVLFLTPEMGYPLLRLEQLIETLDGLEGPSFVVLDAPRLCSDSQVWTWPQKFRSTEFCFVVQETKDGVVNIPPVGQIVRV